MAALKACKQCRNLFEGASCGMCNSKESVDSFKGKIAVLNPEGSEVANKLSLHKKGTFAIRLR